MPQLYCHMPEQRGMWAGGKVSTHQNLSNLFFQPESSMSSSNTLTGEPAGSHERCDGAHGHRPAYRGAPDTGGVSFDR